MSSDLDLVTGFKKPHKSVVVAYDLALDQSMYRVPDNVLKEIKEEFNVEFDPVNCPNKRKFNPNAEIYWGNRIEESMLVSMPNLKWVHFGSVGINRLRNYQKSNLIISSSKGLVTDSMVTHIISLIGIFSRKIDMFFEKKNKPPTRDDYDMYFQDLKNYNELKILILGLGEIGSNLSEKLFYLGCHVDSFARTKRQNRFVSKQFLSLNSIDRLNQYDFVISLLPENKETINIINKEFLKKLNPNSIFINMGRGTTVVENDLVEALDKNVLKMAILDVTAKEPIPFDSDIYKNPKIFFTPHIASFSPSYWNKQKKIFAYNLKCFFENKIKNMINLETNT